MLSKRKVQSFSVIEANIGGTAAWFDKFFNKIQLLYVNVFIKLIQIHNFAMYFAVVSSHYYISYIKRFLKFMWRPIWQCDQGFCFPLCPLHAKIDWIVTYFVGINFGRANSFKCLLNEVNSLTCYWPIWIWTQKCNLNSEKPENSYFDHMRRMDTKIGSRYNF